MEINPQEKKPLSFYIGAPIQEMELALTEIEVEVDEEEAYNRLILALYRVFERRMIAMQDIEAEVPRSLIRTMVHASAMMQILERGGHVLTKHLRHLIRELRNYDHLG